MKKTLAILLTVCMLLSVVPMMAFAVSADTPAEDVAFTNGGVENGAFERKNMAAPTFADSTTEEKHSGLYSQKITFKSGEQFNFWLNVEGDKYNNLPEDDLFITFWAKAGSDGYAGNLCYDPIYFIDSNGTENKKTLNPQYAFGSSTANQELPKEWTKYYISAQRKDTVSGIVKYQVRFSVKGVGTVYLDDFDLVSRDETAFTNGGVENGAFERKNMAAPTFADSTTEEKHSGLYSQKITVQSGQQFNFWLNVEGDKYNNLPENDDLFITFWAKAGSDGYAGNLCYDPIYFYDSNGNEYKKTLNPQYAFGSSTVNQELPKVWTKYYISAQRKDTVSGIVKYQVRFSVKGVGTIYLDDFDIASRAELARDETAFTNGGVESIAFERKNMAAPTFADSTTEEKHSGLYSQKITVQSGQQFNFWLNVEGDKYNNLPENDDLFITFWAKAGSDGYAGNLCYDPIFFYDSNGAEYKKTLNPQYAFGSSTANQELPKEWTKYYISAQRKDTVSGIVKYQVRFSVKGVGTVYLDDFDLEPASELLKCDSLIDDGSSEITAYPRVSGNAGGTSVVSKDYVEKHSGSASTKVVGASATDLANLKISSRYRFAEIPTGEKVVMSFWAKSDENDPFTGAMGTAIVFEATENNVYKEETKLSNNAATYAFGKSSPKDFSQVTETETPSTEWTKYYILVNTPLANDAFGDYQCFWANVQVMGKGTLYIDDFDIERASDLSSGKFDNDGSETVAMNKISGDSVATRTAEDSHSGSYSTKIVATDDSIASFKVVSGEKYSQVPKNENIVITFWAKAGEGGFTGAAATTQVCQATGSYTEEYRLVRNVWKTAFGNTNGSTLYAGESLPTEWNKYYIVIDEPTTDNNDYNCFWTNIYFQGTGTLYVDDFDIELASTVIGDEEQTIGNGNSEIGAYTRTYVDKNNPAILSQSKLVKHGGLASTKISSQGNAVFSETYRLSSDGDIYNNIPLNTQLYVTFWAKADDSVGFSGYIGTGNIYQGTNEKADAVKRDNYLTSHAFGYPVNDGNYEAGSVEISKEWTKYYMKVNENFTEGYEKAFVDINIYGAGTIYLDDFAYEAISEEDADVDGYGVDMHLGYLDIAVKDASFANIIDSDDYTLKIFTQRFKISNTTANSVNGTVTATVKNPSGQTVATENYDFNLGSREFDVCTLQVPNIRDLGKYTVEYSFSGNVVESEFSNVRKAKSNSNAFYNVVLSPDARPNAEYEEIFSAYAATGAEYFRLDMRWDNIEKTKGVYDFPSYYARMFACAAKYGMKPLLIINNANSLYGDSSDFTTFFNNNTAIDAYANFAEAVVTEYADYIDAVEIFNEPNYREGKLPAAHYANILKAVYPKIKAKDSSIKVIGCSTSLADYTYICDVIDGGAGNFMDAVSVHPYVYNNANKTNPESIVERINEVVYRLEQKGCELPVWITEIGWPTNDTAYGCSEEEQAKYLTRTMLALQNAENVQKVFVYSANDLNTGDDDTEKVFGIIKSNNFATANAAKLSYVALSQFSFATSGTQFDSALDFGGTVMANKYVSGNKTVTALWNTNGSTTVDVAVTNGKVAVYDIYGNLTYVTANQGSVSVTVADTPVYVVDEAAGDVNEDGDVNILDIVKMKKNLATAHYCQPMDIDRNKSIIADDLAALVRLLLGLTD